MGETHGEGERVAACTVELPDPLGEGHGEGEVDTLVLGVDDKEGVKEPHVVAVMDGDALLLGEGLTEGVRVSAGVAVSH